MVAEPVEPAPTELEAAFRDALPVPAHLERSFESALQHLLHHPGSMVRPRIVYQMAAAYGMGHNSAMDLAVALEYFHTASLVFDDLPAMDNAASRRGAPCVHIAHGESSAILAALALINHAYALTWRALLQAPPDLRDNAARYLEERLGVSGLLDGQSLDLNYASLPHDRGTTERIASGKTVSLIRLTLVLPAMLGCSTRRELQLLERMAACWGLAYQAVDDLKDVLQDSAESGKTAARDLFLDRPNIALAIGVEQTLQRLARLIHAGDRTLEALLAARPALGFLRRLRVSLQGEMSRLTQKSCTAAGRMEQ